MQCEDSCYLCHGLRGHNRLKQTMCDVFEDELTDATRELDRLLELFKDVCWYNFETKCRTWSYPWPSSIESSFIELHGSAIDLDDSRGRRREVGRFPLFYAGSVEHAPSLPPQIILNEIQDAIDYKNECEQHRSAPFDWAPGGKLYNELLMQTQIQTQLSRKRDRAREAADRISRRVLKA